MGFQNSAPRFDKLDLFIQSLNQWSQRADAAMITTEVPWTELLSGTSAVDYATENYSDLVAFYRGKNFKLWIYIDPQNGLDRSSDALELQAVNKSIADADMQALYREFVLVMDSLFQPEHLGLALETNLIRDAAPASIYQGVKQAAIDAAVELRSVNPAVKLSISVQVDHAWGKLTGGSYTGIDQDLVDFPFIDELGLSSYPYFGFETPTEIPVDYYAKLIEGKAIPVFVSEGGWSSQNVNGALSGTPEKQQAYLQHHRKLLEHVGAIGVFQLLFTDLDLTALPDNVPDNIRYFAFIGLVDKDFHAKPALHEWDKQFHLELR
jgi:hypothetical protein